MNARVASEQKTAPIERIVVILNRPHAAPALLHVASALISRLAPSQLRLLHPRPLIDPNFMPSEEVWTDDRRVAFDADRDRIVSLLRGEVSAWSPPAPYRNLSLEVALGTPSEVVKAASAHADLIVLGNAGKLPEPEAAEALDCALFRTECPVLLVPHTYARSFASHVAVAWKHSEAADEAVEAALPLLLKADSVSILIADERSHEAQSPRWLIEALTQSAKPAKIVHFSSGGRNIGTALLEEAKTVGADLLVMGVFTHPRILEALFGGATRQVLAEADLPVLLHH